MCGGEGHEQNDVFEGGTRIVLLLSIFSCTAENAALILDYRYFGDVKITSCQASALFLIWGTQSSARATQLRKNVAAVKSRW